MKREPLEILSKQYHLSIQLQLLRLFDDDDDDYNRLWIMIII